MIIAYWPLLSALTKNTWLPLVDLANGGEKYPYDSTSLRIIAFPPKKCDETIILRARELPLVTVTAILLSAFMPARAPIYREAEC